MSNILVDKIKVHFSEAMFESFNQKRFGIKSCMITEDPFYLQDLMELYNRALELKECDPECNLTNCCTLNTIEETIKTL